MADDYRPDPAVERLRDRMRQGPRQAPDRAPEPVRTVLGSAPGFDLVRAAMAGQPDVLPTEAAGDRSNVLPTEAERVRYGSFPAPDVLPAEGERVSYGSSEVASPSETATSRRPRGLEVQNTRGVVVGTGNTDDARSVPAEEPTRPRLARLPRWLAAFPWHHLRETPAAQRRGVQLATAPREILTASTASITWTVSAPRGYLPGLLEADLMLVVAELWNADARPQDWSVTVTAYRLLQLMGRVRSAPAYAAVERAMDRLSRTHISVVERQAEHPKGIKRGYSLIAYRQQPTERGTEYALSLPPDTILGGGRMLVDVAPLFALRSGVARRLMLVLATERYGGREGKRVRLKPAVVVTTAFLAQRLPLAVTTGRYPSKVLEVLRHAHAELVAAGLLAAVPERVGKDAIAYQFPPEVVRMPHERAPASGPSTAVIDEIIDAFGNAQSRRFLLGALNRLGDARLWAHFADLRGQVREGKIVTRDAAALLGQRLTSELAEAGGEGTDG